MISIAMTTYNGEQYVARQLETLLAQSLPADEIIICDDGSKDRTVAIVKDFIRVNQAHHIRLVENAQNLGYVENFYKAISLTQGDYIFLADQDDQWHTNKIERSIQVMEAENASILCTNCHLINTDGQRIADTSCYARNPFIDQVRELIAPISFYEMIINNIAQGCTYCFTKEVRDVYLRMHSTNLIHDHQLMFVATLLGKACFLNEPLIDYRLHGSNMVGFADAKEQEKVHWKIPTLKPVMVRFLEDLSRVIKVPYLGWYKLLYYFRIPYFISVHRYRNRKNKVIPKRRTNYEE